VTTPVENAVDQRMLTKPFVLVTTAALAMFVYIGVMIPLLPRLIEEQLGGNEVDIGLNLAVFSLAAVLIRPPLGRFAERHGLRATMVRGALLASVATVVCTFVDSRWGLLPLRCLQGVGEASLFVGAATSITLVTWFDQMPAGSLSGLVLQTKDIDGDCERLRAAGVELTGPQDAPWGRHAILRDPDGNGLVLAAASDHDA